MADMLPLPAPLPTPHHRTLRVRHAREVTQSNSRDSHHACRYGEERRCTKMVSVPRCPVDQVVLDVLWRYVSRGHLRVSEVVVMSWYFALSLDCVLTVLRACYHQPLVAALLCSLHCSFAALL